MIHLDEFQLILLESNIFQKNRKIIGSKNITTNIYRIQAYDSIMCGFFCIGFIDFMLLAYTNLFSHNLFFSFYIKKNDKIVLTFFQYNLNKLKL